MNQLNLLIKPASSLCNMRCHYCFYENEASIRQQRNYGIMTEDTAAHLIHTAFRTVPKHGNVSFSFQGGEPTIAGLAFFKQFVQIVKQVKPRSVCAHFAIQTNGYLLDEQWASFFADNDFLVGLSMDGDKALHNAHRIDHLGNGTYDKVKYALQMLQEKNAEVNLLCVVTSICAKHPQRIYRSLKKTGVRYLQFIPCLDPLEQPRGTASYSLKPENFGKFLCGIFDEWYRDWFQGNYVSVRTFDDYVHLLMGQRCGTCATSGRCGSYVVVESDGSLYPCDFYCLDEWYLGNIADVDQLEQVLVSDKAQQFLKQSFHRPQECSSCQWRHICRGGCKRDWWWHQEAPHNYYCSAYQQFFLNAMPRLMTIARAEMKMGRHLVNTQ